MTQLSDPLLSGIDQQKYAAERSADFTGREWVFSAVRDWLEDPHSPRFFVLTGEPGSGKSAVSAQLHRFAMGKVQPPPGFERLGKGFLDAAHFCSARDGYWIDPRRFATSLSLQLAAGYPEFATALVEQSADRLIQINARNDVRDNNGTVIGVQIDNLNVGATKPADAFNRVVRGPLEALFQAQPEIRVTILVDSLDEALLYQGEDGIASLLLKAEGLPPGARFIVTSRPGNEALLSLKNLFPAPLEQSLSTGEGLARSQDDVQTYVRQAVAEHPKLRLDDQRASKAFLSAVEARSEGNFLYVRYLLEMLEGRVDPVGPNFLDELPRGLNGIYREFLSRLASPESVPWKKKYSPLLGTLAVAREPLSELQLAAMVGLGVDKLAMALRPLRQLLEPDELPEAGHRKYALYHRSFAEFLLDRARAEGYWCMAVGQHGRVTEWYLKLGSSKWPAYARRYGLRYLVSHLSQVILGWDDVHPENPSGRTRLIQQLVDLLTDPEFQNLHLSELNDPAGLKRDLEGTLDLAARFTDQEDLQGVFRLVRISLGLVQFNRERLRPEAVFEMAREGRLEEAEARLSLFAPEADWHQAILLDMAWLASDKDPDKARALRDKVAQNLLDDHPLPLLLERINADLAQPPFPAPNLPRLPPAPPEFELQALVQRLGGTDIDPEMLLSFMGPPRSGELLDGMDYLAQEDGWKLVATALANPGMGEAFLRQYLTLHSSYVYEQYRNRSLWVLLGWVLRHPNQNWARLWTSELARTALAGGGPQFQEALGLTVLGLQARAGMQETKSRLETLKNDSAVAAMSARSDAGDFTRRGEGDLWGYLRRRLAVLAEVHVRLSGESVPNLTKEKGKQLLGHALEHLGGFAGFRAPALMALAGSARVVDSDDAFSVDLALDQALSAAHNIQDGHFCAITTARVNAMRRRWFPGPSDWAQTLERFLTDHHTSEFSALHVVAEAYSRRSSGFHKLALSPEVRGASTLTELARVYQRASLTQAYGRPIDEFRRLNPGLGADDPLPSGTEVNVPDPGFAALLANRFSAEALITPSLPNPERARLVARLVPLAVPNPTALDAVLSRLLLATLLDDRAQLEGLANIVASGELKEPGWASATVPSFT